MFVSALNDKNSFSMHVRDASSTSDDAWRKVWGKEAAAVNPLAAVNHGRNGLILEAIRTNDWSKYHNFQAKQQPAWYDNVNGEVKQNKMYYGNLIDVQNRSLKEAVAAGDSTEIANRKAHMDELISDFKKAPGEIPHVLAFVTDPELAAKHGIGKPANDWYNSPYNNALAASQGRFEDRYWYDNPYFADNPKELTFALEAVQELRPDIASIAAKINKGAYERSVASTSFTGKTISNSGEIQASQATSVQAPPELAEPKINEAFASQTAQIIQQFSASTLVEQLFKQKEQLQKATGNDFLLDQLNRNAEQRKFQVV